MHNIIQAYASDALKITNFVQLGTGMEDTIGNLNK